MNRLLATVKVVGVGQLLTTVQTRRPAAAQTSSCTSTCTYRRRFLARRAGLGEAGRTGVTDVGLVE
jgi:hypothetical protein